MSMLAVQNNGREIAATNYWELGTDKILFSANAGAIRVLVPLGMENKALEMATGKVAVLSIGKDKRYGYERAHLMFDNGTDTPFAIESNLTAFDRLPTRRDVPPVKALQALANIKSAVTAEKRLALETEKAKLEAAKFEFQKASALHQILSDEIARERARAIVADASTSKADQISALVALMNSMQEEPE